MNQTEIKILQTLRDSHDQSARISDLADKMKLSGRSIERAVKNLKENDLVTINDGVVSPSLAPKSKLINRLSDNVQIYKLLLDSGDKVLPTLLDPKDINEIHKSTNLSLSTIWRTLDRMQRTGLVVYDSGRFSINNQEVRLLASIIREEELGRMTRGKGEVLYKDANKLIVRVPTNATVKQGSLTAFSLFGSLGMELRPEFDYYIIPEQKIRMEGAFVHALVSSKNKLERTHCAVFYAINRNRMNISEIRNESEEFGVAKIWMELERYVGGAPIEGRDTFLPWAEFAERCRMYDVDPYFLVPKETHPEFFEELGRILPRPLEVYLIGGENMRIKGMKQATKDVDLVIRGDRNQSQTIFDSLLKLGYRKIARSKITRSDAKLNPSGIFVHQKRPRLDVFSNIICNKFLLLDSMIRDARRIEFGKLTVLLARDEDVFLLKSITGREADDVDMVQILRRSSDFDWNLVLNRLYEQERATKKHYCFNVFDTIDFIQSSSGFKVPIFRDLLNHTTDIAISKVLERFGKLSVKEVASKIGKVEEYEIRNRLQKLVLKGIVKKQKQKGRVIFSKVASETAPVPKSVEI